MNSDDAILTALGVDIDACDLNADEVKKIVVLLKKAARSITSVVKVKDSTAEIQDVVSHHLNIPQETAQKILNPFVETDEAVIPPKPLYNLSQTNVDVVSKREFFEFQNKMINALRDTLSTENDSKQMAEVPAHGLINLPLHVFQTHTAIVQTRNKFEFTAGEKWHSLILGPVMTEGVYKCVIRVSQDTGGHGMSFGCSLSSAIDSLKEAWIGSVPGTCVYNGWNDDAFFSLGKGHDDPILLGKNYSIEEGSVLTAEADFTAHTLAFLRNEIQLPMYIQDIPSGLYFGFCGSKYGGVVVEFVSLQQLSAPSVGKGLIPLVWR